jgi:phage shock protein PspC (stress-responsive transcriptional regulator)
MMVHMSNGNEPKVLVRSLNGRVIAGVCAGLADYFGIDAVLVRVIMAVICVFTAGAGVLAYLLAWIIIPEEGEKSSIVENMIKKTQNGSSS